MQSRTIDGARCLVTGSAGFLGTNLVRALLARGCVVHGFDRAEAPFEDPNLHWFQGDIRSEREVRRACEGVDTIFHTAALIETVRYAPRAHVALVRGVNVEGTRLLIRAARDAGARRLVQTSSIITAYRQGARGDDETSPYSTGTDLYSSTKVAAERLVLAANGKSGLLTCAIRPGGIYGPGERNLMIGPMVEALKHGVPVVTFGNGRSLMDYTYVDNLVDAEIRAAERLVEGSPVCGEAYFVTDGEPINTGDFSVGLVRNMGLDARQIRIPGPVARAIAVAGERLFQLFGKPKPLISILTVTMCETDSHFSIQKAKRHLAYEPLVGTQEGLRRTAVDARAYYDSL